MTIPTEARPHENPWSKLNITPQTTTSMKTKVHTTQLKQRRNVNMDNNDNNNLPNYQREVHS